VDKNTILALVLIAGLGIGGYLYFKGRPAQASTEPLVPERVAQKRAVGTAMAYTSGSNTMSPDLPPQVQSAIDSAATTYKRGSDLVDQGKAIGQQITTGNIGGALSGAGSLVSSVSGSSSPFGGKAKSAPAAAPAAAPAVQAKQAVGQIVAGGRTVSNVRDTAGNVFSSAKYSGTAEFDKLRAAADAAEKRANTGASHF
jgi:hypothetical protein